MSTVVKAGSSAELPAQSQHTGSDTVQSNVKIMNASYLATVPRLLPHLIVMATLELKPPSADPDSELASVVEEYASLCSMLGMTTRNTPMHLECDSFLFVRRRLGTFPAPEDVHKRPTARHPTTRTRLRLHVLSPTPVFTGGAITRPAVLDDHSDSSSNTWDDDITIDDIESRTTGDIADIQDRTQCSTADDDGCSTLRDTKRPPLPQSSVGTTVTANAHVCDDPATSDCAAACASARERDQLAWEAADAIAATKAQRWIDTVQERCKELAQAGGCLTEARRREIALRSLQVVAGSEFSGTAMNDDMTWQMIQEGKIVLFETNFDETKDASKTFKQLARRILALQLFLSFVRAAECTAIDLFAYAGIKTPYPPKLTKTTLEPLTGSASSVTEPLAAHLSVTCLPGLEDVSAWHQHEAQSLCLLSDLMRKRRVCLLTRRSSRIWSKSYMRTLKWMCAAADKFVAERRQERQAASKSEVRAESVTTWTPDLEWFGHYTTWLGCLAAFDDQESIWQLEFDDYLTESRAKQIAREQTHHALHVTQRISQARELSQTIIARQKAAADSSLEQLQALLEVEKATNAKELEQAQACMVRLKSTLDKELQEFNEAEATPALANATAYPLLVGYLHKREYKSDHQQASAELEALLSEINDGRSVRRRKFYDVCFGISNPDLNLAYRLEVCYDLAEPADKETFAQHLAILNAAQQGASARRAYVRRQFDACVCAASCELDKVTDRRFAFFVSTADEP